jgi:hypothetical protein
VVKIRLAGGMMEKENQSLYENQKEVYKFWLGFIEKVALLFAGVVFLPQITGQLRYAAGLLILATVIIIAFIAAMFYLSRKLWYLPKERRG